MKKDHTGATDSPCSINPSPTLPLKNFQSTLNESPFSPSSAPIRNPVVLVPDSDISGSHSQSQSHSHPPPLTQPSESQQSFPSQQNPQATTSHDAIQDPSYPEASQKLPEQQSTDIQVVTRAQSHDTVDHEENQLDTDDEAAHRILTSSETSHLRPHPEVPGGTSHQPKKPVFAVSSGSYETDNNLGRKRTLVEYTAVNSPGTPGDEAEPPAKRQRESLQKEVVIESVEYDALAWKEPSFARARTRAARKDRTEHMAKNRAGVILFS